MLGEAEEDGLALVSDVVTEHNDPVLVKEKSRILHLERHFKYFLRRMKNYLERHISQISKINCSIYIIVAIMLPH